MTELSLVLVFLAGFAATLGLTPLVRSWAARVGLMDVPRLTRHTHTKPVARPGGIAVCGGFAGALLLSLMLPPLDHQPGEYTRYLVLLGGAGLALTLGLIDDVYQFGPVLQLGGQIVIATLVFFGGLRVELVNNPFGDQVELAGWAAFAFTLLWIVGFMNTVNWLDGLDGLAAGVAAVAGVVLCVHSLSLDQPQYSVAALALALVGAALGFLPFNFNPATIFLGSAGSYFLGFALAALAIAGGAKIATAILVVGVPIVDVAWVIVQRAASGASPFHGDRRHLHHRLLDLGYSQRQIVIAFYAACALLGTLALVLSKAQKVYAFTGLVVGIGAIAVFVARRPLARRTDGRRRTDDSS
ncbi:MAG: undecaprenyl/decaprenyl-phosphate alpha-N-acetylglucosaminyl 1-phosphate transferase [Chloroflexi bacterium]|nr:undecaprenyl/decaprenyl-phosphate alpha-N-acetylglucosaminyl 1-phosphate transferase [Chloroflexota bacterium]